MLPTKITVIGAGSASFGLDTLGAFMHSERLHGGELALVDKNPQTLEIIRRLAERMNAEWNSKMKITTHTQHKEGIEGASFVVSAIEVPPREKLWRMDYDLTLKYGVRQPYAENGGPGGFAHAARNISPVIQIARDMEQLCPEAWFVNFSNPMMRICDAIARYSKIKVIGLCHQIFAGYGMVGYALKDDLEITVQDDIEFSTHADPKYWHNLGIISDQAVQKVDIKAAGLNHFTWMLDLRAKATGADLYPRFRECWQKLDPKVEPLTRKVFNAFGTFPIPGDEHLCEYLPWLSDPFTKPWEKYDISLYDWDGAEAGRGSIHEEMDRMGRGEVPIEHLKESEGEGALEVIENIAGAGNHYHLACNLPNDGYINNLPNGAIVEIPAIFSGFGARGLSVGALPAGVAELCRREITLTQLTVDAVVKGDRQLALQCLLFSPGIADLDIAEKVLDDYLITYRQYLPSFWK